MRRLARRQLQLLGSHRSCPASLLRLAPPLSLTRAVPFQINSPLGVYSGDVYKVYFDRVRESNPHESVHPCAFFLLFPSSDPTHRTEPNQTPHNADFDRIIKPLLEREPLELDDADDMELDEEIGEIKQEREDAKAEAAEARKTKKD